MQKKSLHLAPILLLLFFFSSHTHAAKKEANISSFADQTIALLSNPDYGLSIDETSHCTTNY